MTHPTPANTLAYTPSITAADHAPVTLTEACARLVLNTHQVKRLVACGALRVLAGGPGTGLAPVLDGNDVATLAAATPLRGPLPCLTPGSAPVGIAVHCGPIHFTPHDPARPALGVDLLNRDHLSAHHRRLAWIGYWAISEWRANRLVGGIAAADISGFFFPDTFAIRIDSFERVETDDGMRTVFHGRDLDPAEAAVLRGTRIVNGAGSLWQEIGDKTA